MKNRIYLIFMFVLIFSCRKDKNLSPVSNQFFRGIVIDYSTGQPISNADIQLIRADEANHVINNIELVNPIYDFTASDVDGNFLFTVPVINQKLVYKIVPSKAGFIFTDTNISFTKLIDYSESDFNDTLLLDRPSILHINFYDTTITSMDDTLSLSVNFGNSININPYWQSHIHKTPISFNSSFQFTDSTSFKQYPRARILFEVYKTNLNLPTVDTTVNLIQFGTRTIDLFY